MVLPLFLCICCSAWILYSKVPAFALRSYGGQAGKGEKIGGDFSQEGRKGEEGRCPSTDSTSSLQAGSGPALPSSQSYAVTSRFEEATHPFPSGKDQVAVARKKIKRLWLLLSSKATQPKLLVCEANKDLCCITALLLLLYLSVLPDLPVMSPNSSPVNPRS